MAATRKPGEGKVRVRILPKDPLVAHEEDLWPVEIDLPCATPGSGPCGPHAVVIDCDTSGRLVHAPARLLRNRSFDGIARLSRAKILDNPHFHQVNVWAIVERTLAMIEDPYLLARAVPWASRHGRLVLMPHAFDRKNAYYDAALGALLFGSFDADDGRRIHTCLSHDIVAHELGHAILDGLKPLYSEVTSVQCAGFHEYFGDAVAMMSSLATRETARVVTRGGPERLDAHNVVSAIASEFGAAVRNLPQARANLRGAWNRRSVGDLRASSDAHDWSEVLTGVYYDLLSHLYPRIRRQLEQQNGAAAARGKREYYAMRALSRAATITAGVMFRGLDYCPPVDLRYDEYARAVLRADAVAYPLDDLGLRKTLAGLFRARGIRPRHDDPAFARNVQAALRGIDIGAITATPADAYRFLDAQRVLFGIPYAANFAVTSVYATNKRAKSGFRPPREQIIEFAWNEDVALDGKRFGEWDGALAVLPCGGTVVFDGNGNFLHRALVTATQRRRREFAAYVADGVRGGRIAATGAPILAAPAGRHIRLTASAALRHAWTIPAGPEK